ncbi:centrosomal protein 162 [Cricetulus griseus]
MFHFSKEELDEEFEQFMKELSDDSFESSNKTSKQPKKEMKKKDTVPWWITEDDFDDELLRTNVSYLKTKKTSQPIMDTEEESAEKAQFLKSSGTSILSVDSLEANELVLSELHHSTLGLGLDTLEEQEEKEQFFARLEKGLTSSIDYSKLNQELDSDDSTQFRALHSYLANTEPAEDGHESESEHEGLPETYSDDFEDAEDVDAPLITEKEETHPAENSESGRAHVPAQEEEKTGMLANVVLLDSLDSVEDVNLADQSKATPEAKALPEVTGGELTGTGVSYGQSSGDTEALHQAYCHIAHSLGDTGKPRIEASTVANAKSSVKDHLQENEESSKNISTTESDLPTVEELMKPIRIDSYGVSGFDLPPISLKKAADSKEGESVSSLLHKMNTNTVSQDPTHVNQFPYKHDENVTLHKTEGEIMGGGCPAATAMEERLDKMYLEILKKKTTVNPSLLPQDDKTNQTSRTQLSAGEEGPVTGKQVPYKKARSAPPLLKRKPQSGLYMSARSSGYGKPTSSLQLFSALEKKTSKDNTKSKNVRSIPTSNQFRKKEILSGTKLIKPAALNRPSPQSEGSLTTPKQPEDPTADSSVQFQTVVTHFYIPSNIKKEKNHLMEDIKRLKQDKQALEVDLEKVKKERDQAKDQIAYATGEKLYEIKILEETHKQEVSRLQKRLQWYAENQELLDKDAARLREANEEAEKLKLEIEKLKTESGSPTTQQRLRSKERALDAKRIQDLERQVKEMEGILKRRYPNSLPALILAASAAGDSADRNTVEFMERRIKKLEADLEGKDEEAKKSLRTMEQQFQKMKIQYEQRLEEQEQLLAHRLKEAPQNQRNSSARLKALETELGEIKEAHEVTVRKLEAEISDLKHQNAALEHKKNDREDQDLQSLEFQVEQAHAKAKLARLNEELAAKGREIQDLSKTVERLQKERRMMLSRQGPRSREETSAKQVKKEVLHPSRGNANSFSGTLDAKLYHPHTFTDSHVSEVLQENYRLRKELEGLILERNKLKMDSEAAVYQFENSMKRVKDDTAAHIASLKASHQREMEKILCQNALENSSSKVAELNRKIITQEVLIKHFQGQVNELQGKQESLAVSQVREEILQKQITKLLEELKEAKENHTPEMKHFMGLERKIKQMEMRHKQREQELQQIIQQTRQVVETEQNKEVEKWKRLAQLKNRELDKFRTELDSILDVLRELHRQGVVVPVALADEVNTAEF